MSNDKVKRLLDFRKRTYAMLNMQASLETSTVIDIVERAIEAYVNPSIKEIINSEYGEWEERSKTKKSGRPRTKKSENKKETISKDESLDNENKKDSKEKDETNIKEKSLNKNDKEVITKIEDNKTNDEDDLTEDEKALLNCYK